MKRFGLAIVAMAVVCFAARAEAQTGVTNTTITASADIAAILEFDVVKGTIECGFVLVGDTACDDDTGGTTDQAEITVSANSDWLLVLVDDGGTLTANECTFTHDDEVSNFFGEYIMDVTTDQAGNGGTANIDVQVFISGTIRDTGTADESLDVTDDNGAYSCAFDLTLQANN